MVIISLVLFQMCKALFRFYCSYAPSLTQLADKNRVHCTCNTMVCRVKITSDTVIRDLQIGLEVALTAVRGPVKVWAGDADATAATTRASAAGQRPDVGHAVRPVVGALDAASRPTDSATVRCLVHDENCVGRTSGIEVLPLTDLV